MIYEFKITISDKIKGKYQDVVHGSGKIDTDDLGNSNFIPELRLLNPPDWEKLKAGKKVKKVREEKITLSVNKIK